MPELATWIVTGAAGFIGRAVLARLGRERARVVAFVRTEAERALLEGLHAVEIRVVDLNAQRLAPFFVDLHEPFVIHSAGGRVDAGPTSNEIHEALNVTPTVALLEAIRGTSPRAFVLVSTAEVYGPAEAPFREDTTPMPTSAYARSKVRAEQAVLDASRLGFPGIVARLSVVYGPGQDGGMLIPSVLRAVRAGTTLQMTKGEQTRDFVFVADVAEALVHLARAPSARGEVVNVGLGVSHSICDVVDWLTASLGEPVPVELGALPYRAGELMEYGVDVSKLQRLTGYVATTTLRDGLNLIAHHHNAQPRL